MGLEKVALVYSKKVEEKNIDVLEKLRNILTNRVEFEEFLTKDVRYGSLRNYDLIIVLGGDGTFIQVSHSIKDELVLGINSDSKTSEGELMSLNENNIEELSNIFEGDIDFDCVERAGVYINGELVKERALNEIYFGASNQFHTSRYDLIIGNEKETQRSSGVLVVTATGSTAWYKSAGGEPFIQGMRFLVRESFFSRIFKPKFLEGKVDKISFVSDMYHDAVVALDSNFILPIKFGDRVDVVISKRPLRILKVKK